MAAASSGADIDLAEKLAELDARGFTTLPGLIRFVPSWPSAPRIPENDLGNLPCLAFLSERGAREVNAAAVKEGLQAS